MHTAFGGGVNCSDPRRSVRRNLIATTVGIILATHSLIFVRAQAPAFEVSSVKPNKSGTTQANISGLPNGITIVNLPLRGIIQLFFQINQPSKVIGIPDWTITERFDITARAAGPINDEERRLMMQALLADRFKLVARRKTRTHRPRVDARSD